MSKVRRIEAQDRGGLDRMVQVRIPGPWFEELQTQAERRGKTFSELVRRLIKAHLVGSADAEEDPIDTARREHVLTEAEAVTLVALVRRGEPMGEAARRIKLERLTVAGFLADPRVAHRDRGEVEDAVLGLFEIDDELERESTWNQFAGPLSVPKPAPPDVEPEQLRVERQGVVPAELVNEDPPPPAPAADFATFEPEALRVSKQSTAPNEPEPMVLTLEGYVPAESTSVDEPEESLPEDAA